MTMSSSNGDGGPPVVGRRPKSFATESGTAVSVLVPVRRFFRKIVCSHEVDCCVVMEPKVKCLIKVLFLSLHSHHRVMNL
jgi:hypothetical protein